MGESSLGAVGPGDGLRSPVLVVVVKVCPLALSRSIVFIKATSHMNAIPLEVFISHLLRIRHRDSYVGCQHI